MEIANSTELYRDCLTDIENIMSLFTEGRCTDWQHARMLMATLKVNWKDRIRTTKGTPAARVIEEALSRIDVRSNSVPNGKWVSDLYSAGGDLRFHLHH